MENLTIKNTNGLYFDLDFDSEIEENDSQLYGEVCLPDSWLEKNIFAPEEMFVCKLELSTIKMSDNIASLLPKTGRLYFFIDLKKKPYKGIVRYTNEECDAVTGFNDDFEFNPDCNVVDGIKLVQCADKTSPLVVCAEDTDTVILLDIGNDVYENILPFDGRAIFLIDREHLKKFDFSKVKLYIDKTN